jgi:hypothetical protein
MARELTPAATLAAYGAVLAAVFLGGLGVGRAVGPIGTQPAEHGGTHSTDSGTHSSLAEVTR